jgi:Flp pilus assembly protein TadB
MFARFNDIIARLIRMWQKASDDGRGITTSEFWLSLGTIMTTQAGVTFAGFPPVFAGLFLVAVCVSYTLSRGIAKRGQNQ